MSCIVALACSADGTQLLSASAGGRVFLHNLQTRKCVRDAQTGARVAALAFSAEGRPLAAFVSQNRVCLRDMLTDEQTDTIEGTFVTEPVFSPDAEQLAAGYARGGVGIWTIKRRAETRFALPVSPGHAVGFSNSKGLLAAAAQESIYLCDTKDPHPPRRLSLQVKSVWKLVFSPSDDILAVAALASEYIYLWHVQRDAVAYVLTQKSWVSSVTFAHNEDTVMTAGSDKMLRLWEMRCCDTVEEQCVFKESIYVAIFAPDDQSIFVGDTDGNVNCYSIEDGFDPEIAFEGIKNAAKTS